MRVFLSLVLALSGLAACNGAGPPGTPGELSLAPPRPTAVNLQLHWPEAPANKEDLWMVLEVQDWSNPPAQDTSCNADAGFRAPPLWQPPVLQTTEPVKYADADALTLDVKNGKGRVVAAKLRAVSSTGELVLYQGRSEPFDLALTDVTPRPVTVTIRPAPCLDEKVGRGACAVVFPSLVKVDDLPRTGNLRVGVDVRALGVDRVRLSNFPDLPEDNSREYPVRCLAPDGGADLVVPQWDLLPFPDGGCVEPAGCKRTVYARLLDAEQRESPTLSGDVVLDQVRPALAPGAADGGVAPVAPALVNADSRLTVTLRADERLGALPHLTILSEDGSSTVELPFSGPASAGTDVYTFISNEPVSSHLHGRGHYKVQSLLEDLVGNRSQGLQIVGEFDLDSEPPSVSELDVLVDPPPGGPGGLPRVGPGGTLRIAFSSSEPDLDVETSADDRDQDVRVGRQRLGACAQTGRSDGGYRYTCPGFVVEQGGAAAEELLDFVVVHVHDRAANPSPEASQEVILDFQTPDVVPGSTQVRYVPASNSPLPTVTALGAGGTATVNFTTGEMVRADSVQARLVRDGASPMDLSLDRGGVDGGAGWGNTFTFSFRSSGTEQEGTWAVEAEFSDLVGNHAVVPTGESVEVLNWFQPDGGAFMPLVRQDQVLLVRSPWGDSTGEEPDPQGKTAPYLALATLDPTGAARRASPPRDAFLLPDGSTPAKILVYKRPEPFHPGQFNPQSETLLGWLEPSQLSAPDLLAIGNAVVSGVVVTVADKAGNQSAPVAITQTEWVATLANPGDSNPHRLVGASVAGPLLDPARELRATVGEKAGVQDGTGERLTSAAPWSSQPVVDLPGVGRFDHAAYFDPLRGLMVVFGGYAGTTDIRTWDGRVWRSITSNSMERVYRETTRMVFDTRRGRGLLFGGSLHGKALGDTWEWDGQDWSQLWMSCQECREQDACQPGKPCPASCAECTSCTEDCQHHPAPRESHGMAHDPARGQTYVLGGADLSSLQSGNFLNFKFFQDLWAWDGSTWTQQAAPAAARIQPSVTFDTRRNVLVVFGGGEVRLDPVNPLVTTATTWEWNPATNTWADKTGPGPDARLGASMAYSPDLGISVLVGGCKSVKLAGGERPKCMTGTNDVWTWDGTAWSQARPGDPETQWVHPWPLHLMSATMVHDSVAHQVVFFGGASVPWDPENYSPFFRDEVLRMDLVPTPDGKLRAEYVLQPPSRDSPPVARRPVVAWDYARRRLLVFGGVADLADNNNYSFSNIAWEWDGRRWIKQTTLNAPDNAPRGREEAGACYSTALQQVVMGYGILGTPDMQFKKNGFDMWSWTGLGEQGRWNPLAVPDGASDPAVRETPPGIPRQRHGMGFAEVPGTEDLLLFSGVDTNPSQAFYPPETWLWNQDGGWREANPSHTPPLRQYAAMAPCHACGGTLLYSGETPTSVGNASHNDAWLWKDGDWSQVGPPDAGMWPGSRRGPLLVEDPRPDAGSLYLFGGLLDGDTAVSGIPMNDLWEFHGGEWTTVATTTNRLSPRNQPRGGFVPEAGHLLVYAGDSGDWFNDLWAADLNPGQRPALQFDVSAAGAGFTADQVTRLAVHAVAAGHSASLDAPPGAVLLGFNAAAAVQGGSAWQTLAEGGGTGLESLRWVSPHAQEARRYLLGGDMRLTFQVRPRAASTVNPRQHPTVELDYLEARVRYQLPLEDAVAGSASGLDGGTGP